MPAAIRILPADLMLKFFGKFRENLGQCDLVDEELHAVPGRKYASLVGGGAATADYLLTECSHVSYAQSRLLKILNIRCVFLET